MVQIFLFDVPKVGMSKSAPSQSNIKLDKAFGFILRVTELMQR
ncbi:hypothetical protein bthur0011_58110 [Bacillus thuringiensis serovar huazhongensis BGSC 4BD1]|nr:hypothetical protein bthur0011_58110 [Bacillus thuringiensis serovar huazhongensis BGSC 4BD1]